jgi:hypothetical protein
MRDGVCACDARHDEAEHSRGPGSADGDHPARRRAALEAGLRECVEEENITEQRRTTTEEGRQVGDAIGADWTRFDLEQFRAGMDIEFEHGSHDPQTDVTGDDPIATAKIALAHMKEFPDYHERLERMERQAEHEWAEKS